MMTTLSTYHRLNVFDYVESFVGWQPITEMVKYAGNERDTNLIITLFKTGCRISECLALTVDNFTVDNRQKVIVVRDVPLLKRFKKVSEDPANPKKWITEKIVATRKPFPIPFKEPLTKEMIDYVIQVKFGLLFPSPYCPGKPLSRIRAYQVIRHISDTIPKPLFHDLGLDKPFKDKHGNVITNQLHLWLHWARSQRASQLSSEYDFTESELLEWFSWLDFRTATHYSHKGYRRLAAKMSRSVGSYT